MLKQEAKLPGLNWVWTSDWQIDFEFKEDIRSKNDHDSTCDQDGWQYGEDF